MKKKDVLSKLIQLVFVVGVIITVTVLSYSLFENQEIDTANTNKLKESGPDQRPSEWDWERRTFPHYKADAEAYRQEIKKAQAMKLQSSNRGIQQFDFAGPTNIGGRISDIEFNPLNPYIVYAGAANGGVFKSTDMGYTWSSIFDDQANLCIGDIAIDPNNPDIIYIGTGEANGGHNNFPGGGIYKSIDAGATWQFLGLENTVSIGRVVVDPINSDRIFVAAVGSYFTPNPERGIYRSNDGGNTWDNVLFVNDSTGAIDIVIDPLNPSRLIAATWERMRRPYTSHLHGSGSGLYKSLDGGDTWDYLEPSAGLPDSQNQNVGRIGIALCAAQPDVVYSIYTDGSYYSGFYKSTDFGTTWINADPDMEISNGTSSFSWFFGQVRVHLSNPDIVFALDVAYMRSVNGGNNWPIIYGYYGGPIGFHVDQHALAINPLNHDFVISGNDGGINISTDGGVNFTKVAELPITQFYEIGLDANNPQRLYGGTQDNGTVRTRTGDLNDWGSIYGGDGFYVLVDYNNSNIIYAESQFGNLGKSTDGGNNFEWALNGISDEEPKNWSTPVVMDPVDSDILYYGTNHVYRTVNGADFWTSISPDLTDGLTGTREGTISTIGVSPENSSVIWVGTSDSHVWVSTDNGSNWTEVSGTLPYRWVSRVVPDPDDVNTAYVTFSGLKWADPEAHIFRTTNAGATWTDISSNLPAVPINAFVVHPSRNNLLFVGTDLGAYYSDDNGENWAYLDAGLPMVSVYDFKIHPTANYLAIGTHARSMYKLDLSTLLKYDNIFAQIEVSNIQLIQNFPNPFRIETTISFSLKEISDVSIDVFDLNGVKIVNLLNRVLNAGDHSVTWNGCGKSGVHLSEGVYICKVTAGNCTKTQKMLIVK